MLPPVMENEMEKIVENEMKTRIMFCKSWDLEMEL